MAGDLWPSSTPLDTPRRTPMVLSRDVMIRASPCGCNACVLPRTPRVESVIARRQICRNSGLKRLFESRVIAEIRNECTETRIDNLDPEIV
jgi:hypothetical protein